MEWVECGAGNSSDFFVLEYSEPATNYLKWGKCYPQLREDILAALKNKAKGGTGEARSFGLGVKSRQRHSVRQPKEFKQQGRIGIAGALLMGTLSYSMFVYKGWKCGKSCLVLFCKAAVLQVQSLRICLLSEPETRLVTSLLILSLF